MRPNAKMWIAAFALALVATAAAHGQSNSVDAAMTRSPAPAPGPAFPDIPEVDMTQICPTLGANNRFYPERALTHNQTGQVVLDCAFGSDGKPQTCQVLYEHPPQWEFGAAATRIACLYRIGPAPQTANHVPPQSHVYRRDGEGEPVRLRTTVRFNIAG